MPLGKSVDCDRFLWGCVWIDRLAASVHIPARGQGAGSATWVRSQSHSHHKLTLPKVTVSSFGFPSYKYCIVESEGSFASEERNSHQDGGCRSSRGHRKSPSLPAGEVGSWRPSPEWRAFILKLVEAFAEVCLVALVCFGSITSVFLLDFSLQDIPSVGSI